MQRDFRESIFETWRKHLSAPNAFRVPGTTVSTRPSSDEEDTWIRVVRISEFTTVSVYANCPFADAFADPSGDIADLSVLQSITSPPLQQLGPADLFFFDPAEWVEDVEPTQLLPANHRDVSHLLAACDGASASESAVADSQSDLSVAIEGNAVVAACGWKVWSPAIAHIGVLTHPAYRNHGYGKSVAVDVTRRAIDSNLIPQWRSREGNDSSRALACSLGFQLLGRQISVRLP